MGRLESQAGVPSTDAPDLVKWIKEAREGGLGAYQRIYDHYVRKVLNFIYRMVNSVEEAEDLTQDIFLKIFRSLDTFDRRANFQTWLISISRNLCIDYYRSVRKERQTIDRDISTDDLSPTSREIGPLAALEQRDMVALLRQALSSLPGSLRTAVLLRDIQELSYQEIAGRLHLPEGTVKSCINRGRKELARQVERLRGEAEAQRRSRSTSNDAPGPASRSDRSTNHESDD